VGNDQIVPYGTDSRLNLFQGLDTISRSLRDGLFFDRILNTERNGTRTERLKTGAARLNRLAKSSARRVLRPPVMGSSRSFTLSPYRPFFATFAPFCGYSDWDHVSAWACNSSKVTNSKVEA
jgi:hypothetical protein